MENGKKGRKYGAQIKGKAYNIDKIGELVKKRGFVSESSFLKSIGYSEDLLSTCRNVRKHGEYSIASTKVANKIAAAFCVSVDEILEDIPAKQDALIEREEDQYDQKESPSVCERIEFLDNSVNTYYSAVSEMFKRIESRLDRLEKLWS